MPLVKSKPTSAGRRFLIKVVNPELHKGKPCSTLLLPKTDAGGR
ncbi:MAG TPA: 50S ribosomal protein L2, partial [Coxiellaceae bacterium]|nr:50S ribosomal protein L2 [Coxiellaceae bacterium]